MDNKLLSERPEVSRVIKTHRQLLTVGITHTKLLFVQISLKTCLV